MNALNIETQSRTETGKKSSSDLRKEGWIPCNLYGSQDSQSFSATLKSLRPLVYSSDFHVVNLLLDGRAIRAIIKELQFDPVSDALVHVDFMEVKDGKTVTVNMPVKLTGSPNGVRSGGKLYQKSRTLLVKTNSEHLVPHLEINVAGMELGDTIRVGDLKYDHLTLLTPSNIPVAAVTVPRLMKEEVAATTAAAAAAPVEGAAAAPGAAAPADAKKEEKKDEKKK